jgi:hypothetical protein
MPVIPTKTELLPAESLVARVTGSETAFRCDFVVVSGSNSRCVAGGGL